MTNNSNFKHQKNIRWGRCILFSAICALVIGIFAWSARPGVLDLVNPRAEDSYYNLLVQGFRAGQLNVKRDAAPGLAQLSNPYEPALNTPYVWDSRYLSYEMSYYQGKLYLYFGVTPALVLFWPYAILTGHYLPHQASVVIFFACGFLIAARLLHAIWRRYFPEAGIWLPISGALALGLATGILEIISSCDVYEVAKSCAFAFVMLALAGIWFALHDPRRQGKWLLLASLAYGLAIGSRPSLLFGAAILVIPVARSCCMAAEPRLRWRAGMLLAAAVGPITLIGLGLMFYNDLRFGSPFEFGWHYQLTSFQNKAAQQFSLHYFWFNFHFYFLQPMAWKSHFPFLEVIPSPPFPAGYGGMGAPYSGILIQYPVVWAALLAPLAWKNRPMEEMSPLRWFTGAVFLLFVISALTLCLFFSAGSGYESDFLPALVLLAVIGVFGLDRTLAGLPAWRRVACCGWCIVLGWSIIFNILASVEAHAGGEYMAGNYFSNQRQSDTAIRYFQRAVMLQPGSATFHFALANAFSQAGRVNEAIDQYQQALKIKPDYAEADNNLGYTLIRAGKANEAVAYFQKAVDMEPSYQAYYNLAYAYRRNGMATDAIACYQKTIQLQPRFLPAQIDLAWILATWPEAAVRNGSQAVALAEKANEETGGTNLPILRTLAAAYAETGRFPEAVSTAQKALALATTQSNAALTHSLQTELGLYQTNAPCRTINN
jgi:tetratricopeptide (TPR) repeat protein